MDDVTVIWDDAVLCHDPQQHRFDTLPSKPPHPDQPARITNVRAVLERRFDDLTVHEGVEPVSDAEITSVHSEPLLTDLRRLANHPDSKRARRLGIVPGTVEAARHAAGAAVEAAIRSLDRDCVTYAAVRPSGHHARTDQMGGFCYLNNVALASDRLLSTTAVESVAIVDWDVHHGDGTQEIFYDRDDVLYVSLHADGRQRPESDPHQGRAKEVGAKRGEGYTVNVPLPPGVGDRSYERTAERVVCSVLDQYAPDAILVSAGGDAGVADPLGRQTLTVDGFRRLGELVGELSASLGAGVCVIQEGGYHLGHLPFATAAVLEGVTGCSPSVTEPFGTTLADDLAATDARIRQTRAVHAANWSFSQEA